MLSILSTCDKTFIVYWQYVSEEQLDGESDSGEESSSDVSEDGEDSTDDEGYLCLFYPLKDYYQMFTSFPDKLVCFSNY